MKKLLICSILILFTGLILFVGLSFNTFKSNAQTVEVRPTPCDDPSSPCTEPTPQVESVVFDSVNSVLDDNPNIEGGRRIFPDKDSPTDMLNKRVVKVTARLNTNFVDTSQVHVTFKAFDVDDPSIDSVIDPNGITGDDNRGSPKSGTFSPVPTTTGTSDTITVSPTQGGIAIVYLSVTIQPGDNFVVSASVDSAYIGNISVSGTGLNHSIDGALPTKIAKRTEMLTVWRRLHVEVDSMGAPSATCNTGSTNCNKITGTLTETKKVRVGNNTLNLSVSNLEINRFESGRLEIKRNGTIIKSLPVVALSATTTSANTSNSVTITNNTGVFSIIAGDSFTLYDDDDMNSNDGTNLDGDTGEDVPTLNQTYMVDSDDATVNHFAPAYIRPTYDIGNNNNFVPFVLNAPSDTSLGIRSLFEFNQVATEADSAFWTVYLLYGYEEFTSEDEDPETDFLTVGQSDRIFDSSGVKRGQGSAVFLESVGPKECPPAPATQPEICNIPAVKLHEIGHLFGAEHGEDGVLDFKTTNFSGTSLVKIRGRDYP
jgi:hypothetical protein